MNKGLVLLRCVCQADVEVINASGNIGVIALIIAPSKRKIVSHLKIFFMTEQNEKD
jgi:hypothetical protein